MAKKKIINFLFFLILSLILFYIFTQLNFFRHWSSILDQEFTLIYNSLILNSGYKAEYYDHPGHTMIFLISIWLSFLKILHILKFSSFNDLVTSLELKKNLQDVVIYSRVMIFLVMISFVFLLQKINKIFGNKKKVIYYFTLILFSFSPSILNTLLEIRTEPMSSFFMHLLFYFFLLFFLKKNKKKYIFYSGIFFTLSIFTKWQSIFLFMFFPFLIYFLVENRGKKNFNHFNGQLILFFINFIIFCLFVLLLIKYAHGLNFYISLSGYFYLIFITIIFSKFFLDHRIFFINEFLLLFFGGCIITVILCFITKPFHTNNISSILNAVGNASMFVKGSNPYSYNYLDILYLIKTSILDFGFYIKILLKNFLLEAILLIFIIFNIITFIFKKNINLVYFILVFLLTFFSIIFLFSVRPQINYFIYISPLIFIVFYKLLLNEVYKGKTSIIIIVFLIIFNFLDLKKNFNFDKKIINENIQACDSNIIKNNNSYIKWWHKKIDSKFLKKACGNS